MDVKMQQWKSALSDVTNGTSSSHRLATVVPSMRLAATLFSSSDMRKVRQSSSFKVMLLFSSVFSGGCEQRVKYVVCWDDYLSDDPELKINKLINKKVKSDYVSLAR